MLLKNQLTGMRGVYLVAAELSKHGLIASPTSRSARGADILATDVACRRAFSIQVKANAATFSYWLLNENAKEMVSDTHIYVFVNMKEGTPPEFYVVPSAIVAEKTYVEKRTNSTFYSFSRDDARPFQDKWDILRQTK